MSSYSNSDFSSRYTRRFRLESVHGAIKARLGELPVFPTYFYAKYDDTLFVNFEETKNWVLFQRNLRPYVRKEVRMPQKLALTWKRIISFRTFGQSVVVVDVKRNFVVKSIPVKEKPQIERLDRHLFLFWLKNARQILVFNVQNMAFEQTIMLPKTQGWLGFQLVRPEKDKNQVDLCFRNFQNLHFFALSLAEYPYIFEKNVVVNENVLACTTSLNYTYVVSFCCTMESGLRQCENFVTNRFTGEKIGFKHDKDDKFFFLNSRFHSERRPLLLRYAEHRLAVLIDGQNGVYDEAPFALFNQENGSIADSHVTSFYMEEMRKGVLLVVVRKRADGRAYLWRLLMHAKVIRNLLIS